MSKAFTSEENGDDDPDLPEPEMPANVKNYMTPESFAVMQEELRVLLREERPKIVELVSWAAGNGDRSENGDYIYGKKRLREIDRRLRYLNKRLESAEVVDPKKQQALEQVFFGATVTYKRADGTKHTAKLVGPDEADPALGKISWLSPVARALMKRREGDKVEVRTEGGVESIEILGIEYVLPFILILNRANE
jgi:transcription elongation factor GreB